MKYSDFRQYIGTSKQELFRETLVENRDAIRVKKETKVIQNLEKIFEATLKISNEKGFQAMSMRDLSHETGLSTGALYAYFSGKDELLEMLQRQSRHVVQKIFLDHIETEHDPVIKLRTAIRTHLYLSELMQPWFYFSYMETKNLSKAEKEKAIESELYTENIFADILKIAQDKYFYAKRDYRLIAGVIKAMLQDWYLKRWKYAKRNVTVDQYADFVIEFVETYCMFDSTKSQKRST